MKQIKKCQSANGLRGILISANGETAFRVYTSEDKSQFTDYSLAHSDLEVLIQDEDAFVYEYDGDRDQAIDHSPQTLGLPDVTL